MQMVKVVVQLGMARTRGALGSVGSNGYYWSASPGSNKNGRALLFYSGSWNWYSGSRAYGYSVRPVAEE